MELGAVPLCKGSGLPAVGDVVCLGDQDIYKIEYLKCCNCGSALEKKGLSQVAKGMINGKCAEKIETDMLAACGSVSEGNYISALKTVHKLMLQGFTQEAEDLQKAAMVDENAMPASQPAAKKVLSDLLDIDSSVSGDTWQDSVYAAFAKMVPFAEPPQAEEDIGTDVPNDFTYSGGESGTEDWSDGGGGVGYAETWDEQFGPTVHPHKAPMTTKTPNKQAHLAYDIISALAGDDNPLMQMGIACCTSDKPRTPAMRLGTPAVTEPTFALSSSHVVASETLQASVDHSWFATGDEKEEEQGEKNDEWHGTNEQADAMAKFPSVPKEPVKTSMASLKDLRKFIPEYNAEVAHGLLCPPTDHPYISVTRDFQRLLLTSEIGDDMPLLQGGLVAPPPKALDLDGLEPPDFISPDAVDPMGLFTTPS